MKRRLEAWQNEMRRAWQLRTTPWPPADVLDALALALQDIRIMTQSEISSALKAALPYPEKEKMTKHEGHWYFRDCQNDGESLSAALNRCLRDCRKEARKVATTKPIRPLEEKPVVVTEYLSRPMPNWFRPSNDIQAWLELWLDLSAEKCIFEETVLMDEERNDDEATASKFANSSTRGLSSSSMKTLLQLDLHVKTVKYFASIERVQDDSVERTQAALKAKGIVEAVGNME
ncbi:hypothetical protein BDZ89DRAFT_1055316 [Hymenopellis radicata]|nr:hypothetical protein BDZ89DRAFT_1055316 [Hymenopellis radicata]